MLRETTSQYWIAAKRSGGGAGLVSRKTVQDVAADRELSGV